MQPAAGVFLPLSIQKGQPMKRRPVCLVCLILMFGMWLMDMSGFVRISGNPLPESVQQYIQKHPEAVICGEIQQYQETEYSLSVYLKNVFLMFNSEQIPIKNLKVFLKLNKELPVGTSVRIKGKLERVPEARNPGEFDSRMYYACRKIYYYMKDGMILEWSSEYSPYRQFMQELKKKMMNILGLAAAEDAGIFQAMLLGEKTNLDEKLKIRYQMAGIIHILAISGLHISVMGLGLFDLLKKVGFGNVVAGILSLAVLLQYGILTGESVSAMRAVCMFLLAVGARIAGRTYDLLTALAVSAIILMIDAPANLYNSGFWLSFGAVVGIGVVSPVLNGRREKEKTVLRSFGSGLLSSLAIQMTTLPIVLRIYGEVSFAGILMNLFVLPTVAIVLVSGIAAVAVGMLCVSAAVYLIIPGRILLFLYEKLCMITTRIPYCTWIAGSPELWQCAGYYVLFFAGLGIIWCYEKKRKKRLQILHGIFVICMALGIGILLYRPSGNLQITCLDIGQGDCISVRFPKGQHVLIDGGSTNKKNIAKYQILPYLKNQGIAVVDAILISHTDQDHISGIQELFENISAGLTSVKVRSLILPEWEKTDDAYQELIDKARAAGVSVQRGRKGEVLHLGEVTIKLLAPEAGASGADVNEDGMVAEIQYGSFKALFTGDIGEETEKKLLSDLKDVDFLKVGHHGSGYSTCTEFLEVIRPEVAVISCSESNTYGHPSAETIERLKKSGAKIWYTMKSGAVTFTADGEKMWMETYVETK